MPLFLLIFAVLFFPASAAALEVQFSVSNSRGKPLPGVTVRDTAGWQILPRTDTTGSTTVDLEPGKTYLVGRNTVFPNLGLPPSLTSCATPEESAPEGEGIPYRVPLRAPASVVEIVLPALDHQDYRPQAEGQGIAERAFLGLLNQRRSELGLAPLEFSRNLSFAADSYAHFAVLGNNPDRGEHCRYFDSWTRRSEAGFASHGTENSVWGGSGAQWSVAGRAFASFMSSAPHREALLNDSYRAIGVGYAVHDELYRLEAWPAWCRSGQELVASCQLTGDFGDPALARPPEAEPAPERKNPELRVLSRKRRGGHMIWRVGLHRSLDARTLRVRVRGKLRGHARVRKSESRLVLRAPRARGRIIISFAARKGWRSDRLTLRSR